MAATDTPHLVEILRILAFDHKRADDEIDRLAEERDRLERSPGQAADDAILGRIAALDGQINDLDDRLDDHPLNFALQRVHELTGIPIEDAREVAFRLNADAGLGPWVKHGQVASPFTMLGITLPRDAVAPSCDYLNGEYLNAAYVEALFDTLPADDSDKGLPVVARYRDLTGLLPRLHQLDTDGATAKLYQELRANWPDLLNGVGLTVGVPAHPPRKPARESEEGDERTQELRPVVRLAYLSFKAAEAYAEKRLEDREAYNLFKENGVWTEKGDVGELADYELPEFDTWSRYLRAARKVMGEQKYERRSGRRAGKSVARLDEL